MNQDNVFYATGKRKSSIARTWIQPGTGNVLVNNRPLDKHFTVEAAQRHAMEALNLVEMADKIDVKVFVKGGGYTGQAGAMRNGIAKALLALQPDLRPTLKKAGCITRDARKKERKKYGQRGARARFQFSKR